MDHPFYIISLILLIYFYYKTIKPLLKGRRPKVLKAYRAYKKIFLSIQINKANDTALCLMGSKSRWLTIREFLGFQVDKVKIGSYWWEPYLLDVKIYQLPDTSHYITYYYAELFDWAVTHKKTIVRAY